MASISFKYPAASASGGGSNASVGTNGTTAPTSSTEVAGVNGSGNLTPISVDNSGNQNVNVLSTVLPTGAATSANQTNASQKTQIVDGSGNVIASTSNALNVAVISGGGSNASVGTVGSTAPTSATEIGGSDGTNLRAISVDSTGKLNVNNISGTVSLPTGAATSALQTSGNASLSTLVTNTNNLLVTQGSTTSGQSGQLIQGAVTTAAPSYTTSQTSPISLTTAGAVRTDASATTQPVSAASLP
jgi:hypothetical protein